LNGKRFRQILRTSSIEAFGSGKIPSNESATNNKLVDIATISKLIRTAGFMDFPRFEIAGVSTESGYQHH
jgi:hypothetical protein